MKRGYWLCLVIAGAAPSRAETIMDQMYIIERQEFRAGYGNAIGGELFDGKRYALQLADDFATTRTGCIVTEVEVGNLTFGVEFPADARISFFRDLGGRPAEDAEFSKRASDIGGVLSSRLFDDGIGGVGVRTTVSGLRIPLDPGARYFVDVQVYSGARDWAWTLINDRPTGADTHLRDGPRDEGEGGFGWTTWRPAGEWRLAGDAAYRIEAIPEPRAAGLALLALFRRRHGSTCGSGIVTCQRAGEQSGSRPGRGAPPREPDSSNERGRVACSQ